MTSLSNKLFFSLLLLTFFIFPTSFSSAQTSTSSPISPDTQVLIKQLQALIISLQTQINELKVKLAATQKDVEIVKSEIQFTKSLARGTEGDEVKQLQEVLSKDPEIYPEGKVTGFFGPATEAAVKRFQEKHGIESLGTIGPKTRAKLNELITQGAGKSGVVPPGLLTAPGIQKRLGEGTSTATTTPAIPAQPIGQTGTTTILAVPAVLGTTTTVTPTTIPPLIVGVTPSSFASSPSPSPTPSPALANGDTTAPIISNITTNTITQTTANISWTTNEVSTSDVYYSPSLSILTSGTFRVTITGNVTSHSITLSGLSASSTYYYLVVSKDEAGNIATSSVNNFQTIAEPVVTPTTRIIAATAETGGTISPSGSVGVAQGSNKTFIITANIGYTIFATPVDGVNQGAISTYTFTNVQTAHTISATFAQITYAITVTQGANGTISPSTISIVSGGGQVFTIAPANGYQIASVIVDGVNQGIISTYTFTNVTSAHSITATFATPSMIDTAPRIMYWWGKVNQHVDVNGNWLTDSDGVSGANLDKLTYCKKFYQNTTGIENYMLETTNTWRNAGNVDGPFTSINMSTKCLQLTQYSIIVTQGTNGSITPSTTSVASGGSQTFTITPASGYQISGVTVDGVNQGVISTYTFINVTSAHSITATFSLIPIIQSCLLTVSVAQTTPAAQNISPGQSAVSLVKFNVTPNCNGTLNSFAVSLLPMPNGYQNISALRLYNDANDVQLGTTQTVAGASVNFASVNIPFTANQALVLKVVGDVSPSAINGSTVYGVFGGSSAVNGSGGTVGNNASGNIIAGNTMTIQTPLSVCAEPYSFVKAWGTWGSGDGNVNVPRGIAVDAQSNVYVADTSNHRILKFDSNGTLLSKFGSQGTGDSQFYGPVDLAFDAQNNIYVVDNGNSRIEKFDSSGNFISKWGSGGIGNGQFSSPYGIGLDNSGNVYVADYGNNRIQKFDSSGTFISKFGSQGAGNGQFDGPMDVAVDAQGNVYVADYTFNNRIEKFDSSGNYLLQWGGVSAPSGVVLDSSGNVFVAEMSNNYRISKFSSSGVPISHWNNSSSSGGQLSGPWRVAVNAQGNVYVAEIWPAHRIVKFASCPLVSIAPSILPNQTYNQMANILEAMQGILSKIQELVKKR